MAVVETRKIFGGTTHLERVFFYLLALVVLVVFFVGLGLRVKKYMAGRPLDASRFRRARVPLEKPGVSAPVPLAQTAVDIA
ncbi:MAG: Fe-S oxidoreductase, partial [Actinomycetota bacterium]|nr:Fe-S oxidoreductase [Actinomycetota bacterium]